MGKPMRTLVTFFSTAFNTAEMKEAFINAHCYVDDFSGWFIKELKRRGHRTADGPGHDDLGWHFTFEAAGAEHDFVIWHRHSRRGGQGVWIGRLERKRGLIGSAIGGRKLGIRQEAADAVHGILSGSTRIQGVRWHHQDEFEAGREELGARIPVAA